MLQKCLVLLALFIFSGQPLAQVNMNYELLNYMAARKPDPDPNDRDQVKRQFQTYFVKEVFLNSVFKSNHLYYADDNNADYGLVNQLMIDQFAEQIVDMDVIDLSHITIDE